MLFSAEDSFSLLYVAVQAARWCETVFPGISGRSWKVSDPNLLDFSQISTFS
jgi:hypothetical protein